MNVPGVRLLFSAFVFILLTITVGAQEKVDPPNPDRVSGADPEAVPKAEAAPEESGWRLVRGAKELGIQLGFAPTQPMFLSGQKEYDTTGRSFGIGSFRIGRIIGTKGPITYQYAIEVIPVALAFKNEVSVEAGSCATKRQSSIGVGIQPATFRFFFRPAARIKPFVQAGAGFILTNKPVPTPESMRFNFVGDFGGGVMYHLDRRSAVSFGYKYLHISNMNLGNANPGYNASVFYVGFHRFHK